jgi:transcriptional regulator with XRE-family HTH domain
LLGARPGGTAPPARIAAEASDEVELAALRRDAQVNQVDLAARLGLTQGAISKLEHAEDVRLSTVRHYLRALGAHLELVAVFDDEERRVPFHLGGSR